MTTMGTKTVNASSIDLFEVGWEYLAGGVTKGAMLAFLGGTPLGLVNERRTETTSEMHLAGWTGEQFVVPAGTAAASSSGGSWIGFARESFRGMRDMTAKEHRAHARMLRRIGRPF